MSLNVTVLNKIFDVANKLRVAEIGDKLASIKKSGSLGTTLESMLEQENEVDVSAEERDLAKDPPLGKLSSTIESLFRHTRLDKTISQSLAELQIRFIQLQSARRIVSPKNTDKIEALIKRANNLMRQMSRSGGKEAAGAGGAEKYFDALEGGDFEGSELNLIGRMIQNDTGDLSVAELKLFERVFQKLTNGSALTSVTDALAFSPDRLRELISEPSTVQRIFLGTPEGEERKVAGDEEFFDAVDGGDASSSEIRLFERIVQKIKKGIAPSKITELDGLSKSMEEKLNDFVRASIESIKGKLIEIKEETRGSVIEGEERKGGEGKETFVEEEKAEPKFPSREREKTRFDASEFEGERVHTAAGGEKGEKKFYDRSEFEAKETPETGGDADYYEQERAYYKQERLVSKYDGQERKGPEGKEIFGLEEEKETGGVVDEDFFEIFELEEEKETPGVVDEEFFDALEFDETSAFKSRAALIRWLRNDKPLVQEFLDVTSKRSYGLNDSDQKIFRDILREAFTDKPVKDIRSLTRINKNISNAFKDLRGRVKVYYEHFKLDQENIGQKFASLREEAKLRGARGIGFKENVATSTSDLRTATLQQPRSRVAATTEVAEGLAEEAAVEASAAAADEGVAIGTRAATEAAVETAGSGAMSTAEALRIASTTSEFIGAVFDVALSLVFLAVEVGTLVEQTKQNLSDDHSAHPYRNASQFSADYSKEAKEYFYNESKRINSASGDIRSSIRESYKLDQKFWDGYQASMADRARSEQDFYDKYFHAVKHDDVPLARHNDYRLWGETYSYVNGTMNISGVRTSHASAGVHQRDQEDIKGMYGPDRQSFSLGTRDVRLESHRREQVRSDPEFIRTMYKVGIGGHFDEIIKKRDPNYVGSGAPDTPFIMVDSRGRFITVEENTAPRPFPYGPRSLGTYTAYANGVRMTDAEYLDALLSDKTYGLVAHEHPGFANHPGFAADSGRSISQYEVDWYNMHKDEYFKKDLEEYAKAVGPETSKPEIPPTPKPTAKSTQEAEVVTGDTDMIDYAPLDLFTPFDVEDMCAAWAVVCYWSGFSNNVKSYYRTWQSEEPDTAISERDNTTGIVISLTEQFVDGNKRVYVCVNDFDMFAPVFHEGSSAMRLSDYSYSKDQTSVYTGTRVNAILERLVYRLLPMLEQIIADAGEINEVQRVVFCGRGCGGALSALFALQPTVVDWIESITDIEHMQDMDKAVVTRHYGFSMPRFANNSFAQQASDELYTKFFRVSLEDDLLSRFPLLYQGYVHFGEEWVLHSDGSYTSVIGDGTGLSQVVERTPFEIISGSVENYFADAYGRTVKMQEALKNMVKNTAELLGEAVGGINFYTFPALAKKITPIATTRNSVHHEIAVSTHRELDALKHMFKRGAMTASHLNEYVGAVRKRKAVDDVDDRALKSHIVRYAHSQKNPANMHRGVSHV